MSKQAKDWARRARLTLLEKLGPVCAWCQAKEDLEFDLIVPTGHSAARRSTDQRMCHYLQQHRDHDNVQVLCGRCNRRKGDTICDFRPDPELNWEHLGEFAPF